MSERVYLRPPWFARVAGNRMAALFRPGVVSRLSVRGRRSGRWHTVPVAVLDHDHGRYLLAPRGETD
ncbi:MAG TPA: nitroreductase, partial [Streptosporangiaceae bacterium]